VLDRLLERLHANKAELLRVLDHPEIPLHTNGFRNGPVGVNPPHDHLAAGFVLPSVVDTRAAT
jgi:hypothetical protein